MQFTLNIKSNHLLFYSERSNHFIFAIGIFIIPFIISCKKAIEVPPPVSTITTAQVFATDEQATSAISGIYSNMINQYGVLFSSGATTIYLGMSADELTSFYPIDDNIQFQSNALQAVNGTLSTYMWTEPYSYIYGANAILAGVKLSNTIHDSVKNELIGESEFIRAFCYFYLVNLFGDVPLVTTIDWNKTSLLKRTPSLEIYNQIISDLKDAQSRLPTDFSTGHGQRIIPNKWAATALLSRAYLYLGNWTDAETQSTNIIQNSSLFSLPTDLNSVFLSNSPEAIWQLQQSNADFSFNATPEGNQLIPFDATTQPYAYLTNQQLDAFETGDLRKKEWVDSTTFDGATYYYPYKYKVGPADEQPNGPYTEYYMVFRLAEQYLIRAEARAQLGTNLNGAIDDLNAIRGRTGLQPFQASLTQPQILSSVAHERRIELFCEWGHRWLDLKRTGQATTVLSANKGFSISNNALLYPIPFSEITTDPNLTQNAGY